jgi:hypothetical protein
MAAKRQYKRSLAIFVLVAIVAAHGIAPSRIALDWPMVALIGIAALLFLVPQLESLVPLVKKLKIGEAEIELRDQANALAQTVEKSEESVPAVSTQRPQPEQVEERYERLLNTSVEAQILDVAVRDKQAALMRLAIEIEKEIIVLHGVIGLRNQYKSGTFRELVEQLAQHGTISNDIKTGLLEFWKVRNQIAHSQLSDESILTSTLDSGIRLLRIIKAVPRPTYTVIEPHVQLYKDKNCTERITEYDGVLLEIANPDGGKKRMIYPAGREFTAGEVVGWDWDSNRRYWAAYYLNLDSGEPTVAWDSSMAFVGRKHPSS